MSYDARAHHFHLSVPLSAVTLGDGRLEIAMDTPARFDAWMFSRGVHKVTFALVAYYCGAPAVLPEIFDLVRGYIREPPRDKVPWPHLERPPAFAITDRTLNDPAVARVTFRFDWPSRLAFIGYFGFEFVVSLSGRLAAEIDGAHRVFIDATKDSRPITCRSGPPS